MASDNTTEYKVKIVSEGDDAALKQQAQTTGDLTAKLTEAKGAAEGAAEALEKAGESGQAGASAAAEAQRDATEAVKQLATETAGLETAQAGANEALEKVDPAPIERVRDAMGRFVKSTEDAASATNDLKANLDATTAAASEQSASVQDAGASLGELAAGTISTGANLAQGASALKDLSDKAKGAGDSAKNGGKEISALEKAGEEAAKGATLGTHAIHGLEMATGKARFSIRGLRAALKSIAELVAENPFTIWIAGAVALGVGIYEVAKSVGENSAKIKEALESIDAAGQEGIDVIKDLNDAKLTFDKQIEASNKLIANFNAATTATNELREAMEKVEDARFAGEEAERRRVHTTNLRAAGPDQAKKDAENLRYEKEEADAQNTHNADKADRGVKNAAQDTARQEELMHLMAAQVQAAQAKLDAFETALREPKETLRETGLRSDQENNNEDATGPLTYGGAKDYLNKRIANRKGKDDENSVEDITDKNDLKIIDRFEKAQAAHPPTEEAGLKEKIDELKTSLEAATNKFYVLQANQDAAKVQRATVDQESAERNETVATKGDEVGRAAKGRDLEAQRRQAEDKIRELQNQNEALQNAANADPNVIDKTADHGAEKVENLKAELEVQKQLLDIEEQQRALEGKSTPETQAATRTAKAKAALDAQQKEAEINQAVDDDSFKRFRTDQQVTNSLSRNGKGSGPDLFQSQASVDKFLGGPSSPSTGANAAEPVVKATEESANQMQGVMSQVAAAISSHGNKQTDQMKELIEIIKTLAAKGAQQDQEIKQLRSQSANNRP